MTASALVSTRTSLAEIAEILRAHASFVILSHVRPDGDAIGSQTGLGLSLRALGKQVTLINEDGCPDNLDFLPGSNTVHQPDGQPVDAEVVIAVDTAARERLGANSLANLGDTPRVWINIDHHVSNPGYGDHVHIDPASPATGQIIYELLVQNDLPVDDAVRRNLFAAISTDTGSFQYPSTTARTFAIASEMVAHGLDVGGLSALLYHRRPLRKVVLLQRLFQTLQLSENNRVADWQLTAATKDELNLKPEDSEDLIDQIRSIDTVQVAVFFEELPDGKVRVSSRSKDRAIDVCRICQQFGGGGHPLASGARLPGPLSTARQNFLQAIHEALPQT
jgi:bifunctional oligoribonuclease and PAP phosphatase NrnA